MSKTIPPNWNLKDFYSGISDPKIKEDKKEIEKLADNLTKKYKDKINSKKLTPDFMFEALTNYNKLIEKLHFYTNYPHYLFSTDTKSDKIKNFFQKSNEFGIQINSQTIWFELEWIAVDEKIANKIINNEKLDKYKHYLTQTRTFKPFTLSEKEEQILSKKSQTSSQAFVRLYDQTESQEKFEMILKGKKQILNSSEITSIMKTSQTRSQREKASTAYSKTYSQNSNLYTYILNTLLLDKKVNDEIRKYEFPQQATFLGYEVNAKTVETMTKVVEKNRNIVENFYIAKKRILKTKELHEWDRYSDIVSVKEKIYSWDEAKEIVLGAFKKNSEEFYKIAKLFFDNNWIDAKIKDGKTSGAYCSYSVPSKHPLVFMNFSGKVEDISTLAHELGHAIHAYLSKKENILEFYPSTAVAEMASTFAESLVFEKLYKETSNKKDKLNLLGKKIQNNFATVFRQNDFYIFETKLHELRKAKGELTKDEISNLYQEILQKSFGKGLILTKSHKNFWMPISHFYHYNFYVFTYVFGELIALSVFAKYKLEGKSFLDKYIKALSVGGSFNPYEITKIMGIDLETSDFWQNGIELIRNEVEEFEKMVS